MAAGVDTRRTCPDVFDLPASVICNGLSRHVDRRLEASHKAVHWYRNECKDSKCEKLSFATWRSNRTGHAHDRMQNVEHHAALALYEQAANPRLRRAGTWGTRDTGRFKATSLYECSMRLHR